MMPDKFWKLQPGDIVRHAESGESYMVTSNYGERVTAVRTVDLTNPHEWQLALKAKYIVVAE